MVLHQATVSNQKVLRIQCDEVWKFCLAKQKNLATAKAAQAGAGDIWTWTAIDADAKLMVSFVVRERSGQSTMVLMDDLRAHFSNRIQLIADGHKT